MSSASQGSGDCTLSFVVIGYNEGANIRRCIESIRGANLDGIDHEIIYADGGSTDESIALAREAGAGTVCEADQRRRAAANRNAGARAARGTYLQFVDGDMTLDADWPRAALAYLEDHPAAAVACGRLRETARNMWHRALELDWNHEIGEVTACGGTALMRAGVFLELGGFPEDVQYGEEPLLCWRIRNERGLEIHQLDRTMAHHDLGLNGFGDYWRQYVRNGRSYAEIAARCANTPDPLWSRERTANYAWAMAILVGLFALLAGPAPIKVAVLLLAALVLLRKTLQSFSRGHSVGLSLVYALHTYFCHVPMAFGQLKYALESTDGPDESHNARETTRPRE